MLLSTLFSTLCNNMAAGTLYTAFLTLHNFSLKDVSIIGFIPTLAGTLACLISPVFWERILRRKPYLTAMKLFYWVFTVLGITVLPYLVEGQAQRVLWFGVITFIANFVNVFSANAYSAWHLNFLPDDKRASFYTYNTIVINTIGGLALVGAGAVADMIKGTPNEGTILVILRILGFVFALGDVLVLTIPKEYSYVHEAQKIKFTNIFILPFRHKRFLMTMAFLAVWAFAGALSSSSLSYHLMNQVGVKVWLINLMNFLYGFIMMIFSPMWQKVIRKHYWFATFSFGVFIYAPTFIGMAFVAPGNWAWLYPILMVIQYIGNVPISLGSSNMTFINMPKEDRTYFFAFGNLRMYLFNTLGQMTGTLVISCMGNSSIRLFGRSLTAVPILLISTGILQILFAIVFFLARERITPPDAEYG